MSSRAENFCLWIIGVGTIAILFLPLLVYSPTLYPYIFGKIIAFRILVEIIFAVWLFLVIYCKGNKEESSEQSRKYQIDWKNPIILTLTVFMGILILTMFTGVDIARSFWSTQERMTGVLTIIHFYAWFLILISCFRNWQNWRKFIWASLICFFLVGLFGLGQRLGWQFLLKSGGRRMSATLGNPDFLAVYALVHFFLAGFLILVERKWILKGLAILLSGFSLTIMFLTACRGAVVAFGLSVLLFLVFLIFIPAKGRKSVAWTKILAIFLILIIIGGGTFLYFQKDQPWIKKAPFFIRRLASIGVETNRARLISWEIGIKGFKEKPILGYGWENYNVVFNKHYQPWFLRKGAALTWFDRSHNQVVDLLALTGSLGTAAYLAVFGAIFWLILRKIRKTRASPPKFFEEKLWRASPSREVPEKGAGSHPKEISLWRSGLEKKIGLEILACMLLAYFIQNLFIFDTPAPLIVFYFGLGLIYFVIEGNRRPDFQKEVGPKGISGKKAGLQEGSKFPLPVLIFLIIIFLPWAVYKFNIEPLQQSKLGVRGIHTSKVDLNSGLYWYKKALAKPVFTNPEIRLQLAKTVAESYNKSGQDLSILGQGIELAISESRKNVKEHPRDVRYYLYSGQLYNLGSSYNQTYPKKAKEVLEKGLELSPKRQHIYFELARVYLHRKEYDKAIEILQQAVDLDDQVKESRQNLEKVLESIKKKEG